MAALRCSGGPVTARTLCARLDGLDEGTIAAALARQRNQLRVGARRGRDGAWLYEAYEASQAVPVVAGSWPAPGPGVPAPAAGEPVVQVTATRSVSVLHAELVRSRAHPRRLCTFVVIDKKAGQDVPTDRSVAAL